MLAGWYNNISTIIGDSISSAFNGLVSVIETLTSFIVEIPQNIFNLFKGLFDVIITILTNILDFFFNFFENLFNFIKYIFIPSDNFFENSFNEFKELFLSKFQFIEQLNDIFDSIKTQTASITGFDIKLKFDKYNTEVDFGWYEPYRIRIRQVFMGAFSLMFIGGIVKRNDPRINMGGN